MPRAPTWRDDASLVQLSSDSTDTGETLGAQVIHDGPQICGTVLCVCPDGSHDLFVADGLAPERSRPIAKLDPTRVVGSVAWQ